MTEANQRNAHAEDVYVRKYGEVVEELRARDLPGSCYRVYHLILFEAYFIHRADCWRVTKKMDLVTCTGIELKNLIVIFTELKRRGMLKEWKDGEFIVLQPRIDPAFWVDTPALVDRQVYYRELRALRSHNLISQPSLPGSEFERDPQLIENFASVQGHGDASQDESPDRPPHQDRRSNEDARKDQGDTREPTPANAVHAAAEGGGPGSAGAAMPAAHHIDRTGGATSTVPQNCPRCGGTLGPALSGDALMCRSCYHTEMRRRCTEIQYPDGRETGKKPPSTEIQYVGKPDEVLKFSTSMRRGTEIQYPSTTTLVTSGSTSTNTSDNDTGSELPPKVLDAHDRRRLLEALKLPDSLRYADELLHALKIAGAFQDLQGGNWQPFWRRRVRMKPEWTRTSLLALKAFVLQTDSWPDNVGGWLADFWRDSGYMLPPAPRKPKD